MLSHSSPGAFRALGLIAPLLPFITASTAVAANSASTAVAANSEVHFLLPEGGPLHARRLRLSRALPSAGWSSRRAALRGDGRRGAGRGRGRYFGAQTNARRGDAEDESKLEFLTTHDDEFRAALLAPVERSYRGRLVSRVARLRRRLAADGLGPRLVHVSLFEE